MARLPQPGSDNGTWGDILNDYLSQSHNADGTIKNGVVPESALSSAVQTKLNATATPTKADVGLGNVDNTSDATKNAAAATLTNKTISGSDNTLSDIPEAAVTGLVTDLAAKANVSDLADKVSTATTINGHPLSGNVTVTGTDVLPAQFGSGGKYLTTDGTSASWGDLTSDPGKVTGSNNGVATDLTLWVGTATQYDAIATKDSNTVYVVTP